MTLEEGEGGWGGREKKEKRKVARQLILRNFLE